MVRQPLLRNPDGATDAAQLETVFTEAGSEAVAALLHLMRLMGAELVLTQPGLDCARFEEAVRAKIQQFTSPTPNPRARETGLAHARYLVERVLLQIRAQAELKRNLTAAGRQRSEPEKAASSAPRFPN
jgi:hypothetical protein